MVVQILSRLRLPKKEIEKVARLVRYHLFYYNVDEVKEGAVRRLVRNVGLENINELLQVRMADRIGSGVAKAEPYRLRHLRYMIERVARDPISVGMLAVNGHDVMRLAGIGAGVKVGWILTILLAEVLEDSKKNNREFLERRILELVGLSDDVLKGLAEKSREVIEMVEKKEDEMTRKKYWVV